MREPFTKAFDPEDPMELVGVELPGESDDVLDGIAQEYLFMGWSAPAILFLFRTPQYTATHRIYREKGEAYVKERIRRLADQWNQGWIRGGTADA
ncbi:MAG: hypothetical protein ACE5KI_00565 [Dehalococcoidia bacterium]